MHRHSFSGSPWRDWGHFTAQSRDGLVVRGRSRMQESKRSAVMRALIPSRSVTCWRLRSHRRAIVAGTALSPGMLRWPVALLLAGLGVRRYTATYIRAGRPCE